MLSNFQLGMEEKFWNVLYYPRQCSKAPPHLLFLYICMLSGFNHSEICRGRPQTKGVKVLLQK